MKFKSPGKFDSTRTFTDYFRAIDPSMGADEELLGADGPLGEPLEVAGLKIRNRFAVHPMEGWDAHSDGTPSEHTRRRWRHFGRSGAKLIWGGEAFAVQEDGRANPNQLYLNRATDVEASLRLLLDEIRAGHEEIGEDPDELVVGLQLTHSGRFARPAEAAPRIAAHHPVLDKRMGISDTDALMSDDELETMAANYVEAAQLAHKAGYHFVDVKCCHGYLLHELLGAKSRPGPYGGSFENRTRLFRHIVTEIRQTCPGLVVGVRVSIADVFPHTKNNETGVGEPAGWDEELPFEHGFGVKSDDPRRTDLEEPFRFLELLRDMDLTFVNISLGSPYYCPHVTRPAAYPPSDGYLPPEDPLAGVVRHIRIARACKEAFPEFTIVGTGYSYLQEQLPHVAQFEVREGHVDLVGLGRMVLSYPELPRDVLARRPLTRKKLCRTFSDCTTAPRHGLLSGCYPLDRYYQALPQATEVKAIKKAIREDQNK